MQLVVFGLTISSSWGNGHATIWRGLCRGLARRGHAVTFFERDVPYYAGHRDAVEIPGCTLRLYGSWDEVAPAARRAVDEAGCAMVTSYCPDALAATELVLDSRAPLRVFYDLDTPVTFARLAAGEEVPYVGARGLGGFDVVLSFTGGAALRELRRRLGARRVAPLYGSVDPQVHHPVAGDPSFAADLSYLGTYAEDRQERLEALFLAPARARPARRFLIGGALYPQDFPWAPNVWFARHVPPAEHAAFYCSSRLTLNVTRAAMAAMGHCPSGRLFEAAACGTPVVTDSWDGLDEFFTPGEEIVIARGPADVLAALELSDAELGRIGAAARERALAQHSADRRAEQLLDALERTLAARSAAEDAALGR
ncbi:MAG TPA: glycosyltransferase [Polyangia bacterium]|jgi:spore maturation protein CgeB